MAGLFRPQLGVQLREQVGVLIGRQRPPIPRHVPQPFQTGAGEAREGEAARRIDDLDQAALQQGADRGAIQLGLALQGAARPAVQPDAVVERVGLPAACPERRADQRALGGGERGRPAVSPPPLPLPLYTAYVPAGFPSPADDDVEGRLDLNPRVPQFEVNNRCFFD